MLSVYQLKPRFQALLAGRQYEFNGNDCYCSLAGMSPD